MSKGLAEATLETFQAVNDQMNELVDHINKDKEHLGGAIMKLTATLAAVVTLLTEKNILTDAEIEAKSQAIVTALEGAVKSVRGST